MILFVLYYLYYSGSILYINNKTRYESNIDWIDPDLPSKRCSIEYFTVLSSVCGSDVTMVGSSGRSSITGQLNHFSPTYSDFIFSLKIQLILSGCGHQGTLDACRTVPLRPGNDRELVTTYFNSIRLNSHVFWPFTKWVTPFWSIKAESKFGGIPFQIVSL